MKIKQWQPFSPGSGAVREPPLREHISPGKPLSRFLIFLALALILTAPATAQTTPPHFREVMEIELRPIQDIVWHPNGEILAAAGEQDVWLYHADTLTTIAHLDFRVLTTEHHLLAAEPIKWSPDGKWLLAHFDDGWRVWEYSDGQFTRILEETAIDAIRWSPDGAQYLIVNDDGAHIHAGITGQLMRTYTNVTLQWSPNSGYIAAIAPQSITLLDSMTFNTLRVLRDDEAGLEPERVYWSPNSRKIAAISNNRVLMWDVRSGRLLFEDVHLEPFSETQNLTLLQVLWGPGSDIIVVEGGFGNWEPMYVLNAESGEELNAGGFSAIVDTIGLTPDGTKVLASYVRDDVDFYFAWDITVDSGGEPTSDSFFEPPLSLPTTNPDRSRWLAIREGAIHVFDGNSLETISVFDGQTHLPLAYAWSPDESKLAALTLGELQVWDVPSGTMLVSDSTIAGAFRLRIEGIDWNSDGRYYAAVVTGDDGLVRVWDTHTALPVNSLYSFDGYDQTPQWGRSTRPTIVTVYDDEWAPFWKPNTTMVWDALTSDVLFSSYDHLEKPLNIPAVGPNARYIAGTIEEEQGEDQQRQFVIVWDTLSNEVALKFEHPRTVEDILWHPDNLLLLLTQDSDTDGRILDFYDATSGALLHSMPIDEGALSLSADGTLLALEHDGNVVIYSLDRSGDTITVNVMQVFFFSGVTFRNVRWHHADPTFAVVGTVSAENTDYLYIWDLSQAPFAVVTADLPRDLLDYAWRDDGRLVLATGQEDNIQLWEAIP